MSRSKSLGLSLTLYLVFFNICKKEIEVAGKKENPEVAKVPKSEDSSECESKENNDITDEGGSGQERTSIKQK